MNEDKKIFYIGTAGWSLSSLSKAEFAAEGSHLERYASVFNSVEINSSFYRDHKPETYTKWAACVPDQFRFSVKLSRYFTQQTKLREGGLRLRETLFGISQLKDKWGALLVQLPPSLVFNAEETADFLDELRTVCPVNIVWEPRHASWTTEEAVSLLSENNISKVMADPEPCRLDAKLGRKVRSVRYLRLHGQPEIYKSNYNSETLSRIAGLLSDSQNRSQENWIIFDNTTFGFALQNAMELKKELGLNYEKL